MERVDWNQHVIAHRRVRLVYPVVLSQQRDLVNYWCHQQVRLMGWLNWEVMSQGKDWVALSCSRGNLH